MIRLRLLAPAVVGLFLLGAACFGGVLLRGEQFGFRDAAHYYYPLHLRTALQWRSGGVPLWDPSVNGGMPLLGNPTAAVLYPGKLVFAVFPFPWATRLYLIGHVGLAFAMAVAMLRGLGIGGVGATLGGLSYAFGGPVLLQYSNAIYLVGAAWMPLGLLGADGWLRGGRVRSLATLAVALAMQCLGGDVQSAYVLGMVTAIYAAWLSPARDSGFVGFVRRRPWTCVGIALTVWLVATLVLARWLPSWADWRLSSAATSWIGGILKLAILALIAYRLLKRRRGLAVRLTGLIGAAAVGFALAGAQLLPMIEASVSSIRMARDNGVVLDHFSVEPIRLAEVAWPGVFGAQLPENRYSLMAIPSPRGREVWTHSLYVGGLTLVLALCSLRTRNAPAWQGPMVALAGAALLLSFGVYGGPLWWARSVPGIASVLGPVGGFGSSFLRPEDGQVRDGFGSAYGMLTSLAPGFSGFRFPAKFLTMFALAVSALAALGWENLRFTPARGFAVILPVLGAVGLALVLAFRGALIGLFTIGSAAPSLGGPLDPQGAWFEMLRGLVHGMVVAALSVALMVAAKRDWRWTTWAAILVMAVDLATAHARLIWTVPQFEFDRESMAASMIAKAERDGPSTGPFRIHRMAEWYPPRFRLKRSPDRLRELVAWGRDTLQPAFATVDGLSYTLYAGNIETFDFSRLFEPWVMQIDAPAAGLIGARPGQLIRYHPRRAFDLWGSRYFLLPSAAWDWLQTNRALASFLPGTHKLFPPTGTDDSETARWQENEDWQLLRNEEAFPRAWIVHDARVRTPLPQGEEGNDSSTWRQWFTYQPDPFWEIPGRQADDPRIKAAIEADDPRAVRLHLAGAVPSSSETVIIERDAPSRVEIAAHLKSPGLVILSNANDPGWSVTLDGKPNRLLRANGMMQATTVPAGNHRLVFTYQPRTWKLGLILSGLGVPTILLLMAWPPTGTIRQDAMGAK